MWPTYRVRVYPMYGGRAIHLAARACQNAQPFPLARMSQLLESSGYFPTFGHALQTLAGFDEMGYCMTLLHRICGSEHLGDFPRRDELPKA